MKVIKEYDKDNINMQLQSPILLYTNALIPQLSLEDQKLINKQLAIPNKSQNSNDNIKSCVNVKLTIINWNINIQTKNRYESMILK